MPDGANPASYAIRTSPPLTQSAPKPAAAIRRTVENSARQCYVIEGVYPPDLKYLEENYGLQINTDEFYIQYDIYASNQPPSVKVVGK